MGSRGSKGKSGGISPIEAYSHFIEGGSNDIHNAVFGDRNDGKYKLYPEAIDKLMVEAEDDISLFKGAPLNLDEIEALQGKTVEQQSFSSTSQSRVTALSYADNAFDLDSDSIVPVVMNVTVKKGTPIADAQKILGSNGMKAFEKEITVGRKTKWKYGQLKSFMRNGETYYKIDVTVSK